MNIKSLLIEKCGIYFEKWTLDKLEEIYEGIDIEKIRKHKLLSIAKLYIKSIYGDKILTSLSKGFYIVRGHSEEYAIEFIKKIQINNSKKSVDNRNAFPERYTKSLSPMQIEFWLLKGMTVEESEYKIKTQRPVNKEYWINKGFSEEESLNKISTFQESIGKKYAEKRKNNPDLYISTHPIRIEYWIAKGFTEEESKLKLKEHQNTFSLEKCIQKYGEVEGLLRFNERQKKWKKSLDKNFEKYGDGRSPQSLWASEIIDFVCDKLKIERPKKEKWISSKNKDLKCSYDFTYGKKIIEFNGNYWHCNPETWDSSSFNNTIKKFASDKWKSDEEKIKLAEFHGYSILTIWESDYVNDKSAVISKCLKFLK